MTSLGTYLTETRRIRSLMDLTDLALTTIADDITSLVLTIAI